MDGTALGILGCLSSFQRITCTVPSAKRIAVEHFIMRKPNSVYSWTVFLSVRKQKLSAMNLPFGGRN